MDGDKHPQFSPFFIGLLGVIAGAIVVVIYHFFAVSCCNQRREPSPSNRPQTNQEDRPSSTSNSLAQLIPIFKYPQECGEETGAVCLSEFKEGEEVRLLPECLHLYYVTCIDGWLNSHSNCPLCRADTIPPLHAVLSTPSPGETLQPELHM